MKQNKTEDHLDKMLSKITTYAEKRLDLREDQALVSPFPAPTQEKANVSAKNQRRFDILKLVGDTISCNKENVNAASLEQFGQEQNALITDLLKEMNDGS